MKQSRLVNSDSALGGFLRQVSEDYQKHRWITYNWTTGRQRTPTQNNAIHLYCRMVAAELNEKGFSAYLDSPILKSPIETEWTEAMVKSLWKTVQGNMFPDKPASTTKLERAEVSEVYHIINRALIEKTSGHVSVAFPSREIMSA